MPTPPAAPCTTTRSPSVKPHLREQGIVRRREHLGEAAGLGPTETFGDWQCEPIVHNGKRRLGASADDRHDAVTDREPHDAGTGADDFAGELHAGDVLRRVGRRRVQADTLQHVGAVEPSRAHGDEQLAHSGLRVGVLAPLEGAVDDRHRVHGRRLRVSERIQS